MTPVGGYLHMIVESPDIAKVQPGHFAALAVGGPSGATLVTPGIFNSQINNR